MMTITTLKHVDFTTKKRELHKTICQEIASVMAATGTKELDLRNRNSVTIQMEHKFTGETIDVEVLTVTLKNDDIYITSPDWNYCEEEICISKNQYVIPCSIEELYNAVFEICVNNQ